jgi:hypothetical protein
MFRGLPKLFRQLPVQQLLFKSQSDVFFLVYQWQLGQVVRFH